MRKSRSGTDSQKDEEFRRKLLDMVSWYSHFLDQAVISATLKQLHTYYNLAHYIASCRPDEDDSDLHPSGLFDRCLNDEPFITQNIADLADDIRAKHQTYLRENAEHDNEPTASPSEAGAVVAKLTKALSRI